MAATARGFERQVWTRMALLWQALCRDDTRGTDDAGTIVPRLDAPTYTA